MTATMTNVKTFQLAGLTPVALEIEQTFPRESFVVPIAEAGEWFTRGFCVNPSNGNPCDLQRVQWDGSDVASFAHHQWRTDGAGSVVWVRIVQNWNTIALLTF